jgi:hypothetical protein
MPFAEEQQPQTPEVQLQILSPYISLESCGRHVALELKNNKNTISTRRKS